MSAHDTMLRRLGLSAFSCTVLAGCPNAGSTPTIAALTSSNPSATPLASTPSAATSPAASPPVAPASATSPASPPGGVGFIKGSVYDEAGRLVIGASVRLRSLSAGHPYDQTVRTVDGGGYALAQVPAGIHLEVSATRLGWTTRKRVEVPLPDRENVIDFGGPGERDAFGPAYFISDYPEITSIEPTDDEVLKGDKLELKASFSEPLDAANRWLAEKAFLVSSSQEPHATGTVDLARSTGFLENYVVARLAWNEAGDVLSYTFNAPLLASTSVDKRYTVMFVRPAEDAVIKDESGKVLGFVEPGPAASYPYAIKRRSLSVSGATNATERWQATHTAEHALKVRKEVVADLKLEAVEAYRLTYNHLPSVRFTLRFNRPLRVYAGNNVDFEPNLGRVASYVFALSDTQMDQVSMDRDATVVAQPEDASRALVLREPFTFNNGEVKFAPGETGQVTVTVDQALVPRQARFFKVKVPGIKDPYSVVVSTAGKNATNLTADNIKIGTL